ncbi:hypothetical protein D3C72_2483010 [compost metagenome]
MKTRLVVHFGAGFDPIAQIHMGQAQGVGLGNLPHHVVGAVAAVGLGFIEGVDSR